MRLPRLWHKLIITPVIKLTGYSAIIFVVIILIILITDGLPTFREVAISDLFSQRWYPIEGYYGILPLLAGSLLVTIGATVIALPLGVGTALFIAEIAPRWEADESTYFVPAVQMRALPPEEISSINPEIENKRMDVNLSTQTLICYEKEQPVLETSISSGVTGLYDTPTGRFNILVKLPSRRMSASDLAASDEENVLAGVPWCSFFTDKGHAIHGTYWHNNFGVPMSHGCINMRNEDAKWLFRWSTPTASFEEIDKRILDKKGYGTTINIHS